MSNSDDLTFQSEIPLNTKPILIDLLVCKNSSASDIQNNIGNIFRKYNIFEYKSPQAALNIDTFFKSIAYACLYKTSGSTVNSIKIEDITITIIRKRRPVGLFHSLKTYEITIQKFTDGIYHILTGLPLAIQVIVSKELDDSEHIWLSSLTDDLSFQTAEELITSAQNLKTEKQKEYMDSVLQVVMAKNHSIFQKLKEVPNMCEALRELMEPEISAMIAEKDTCIKEQAAYIKEQDARIKEQDAYIMEKDAYIMELKAIIAQHTS